MFDTKAFLESLAIKWTAKYPDHADRIARGLEIALAGKVAPRGLDSFRVVGSAPGTEYVVEVLCGFPRCSCPDHRRGSRCKHTWACALMTRLAAEIEEKVAGFARPRNPARPRQDGLSRLCAEHHDKNHQRLIRIQK